MKRPSACGRGRPPHGCGPRRRTRASRRGPGHSPGRPSGYSSGYANGVIAVATHPTMVSVEGTTMASTAQEPREPPAERDDPSRQADTADTTDAETDSAPTGRRHWRLKAVSAASILLLATGSATFTTFGERMADWLLSLTSNSQAEPSECDGAAALTAHVEDAARGSVFWATANRLPDNLADQLNAMGPDDTEDKLLGPFEPVKMTQHSGTHLRLILVGQCPTPVIVKKIYSVVRSRTAPLSGGVVFLPPQGDIDVKTMAIDLDAPNGTEAMEYDAQQGIRGAPYFQNRVIDLKPGEAYPIDVFGLSKRYYVEWSIGIDALVKGRTVTATAMLPSDRPIRSTAAATAYQSAFVLSTVSFQWERTTSSTIAAAIG
jgi:hypothetical protein